MIRSDSFERLFLAQLRSKRFTTAKNSDEQFHAQKALQTDNKLSFVKLTIVFPEAALID
jgi:hypothetical protein